MLGRGPSFTAVAMTTGDRFYKTVWWLLSKEMSIYVYI